MANYQLSKTGAEIDAALDLAIEHETSKADVAGNLPAGEALHAQNADFASQIETDREIDDADEACPPTVFGTVGGDAEVQSGLMKFEELRGNTIKWNQLCKDPTFATASMWDVPSSMTIQNNKITMPGAGNSSTAFSMSNPNGNNFKGVNGHIYIFSAIVTSSAQTTGSQFRVFTGSEWGYPSAPTIPAGTSRVSVKWTFNKTSSQACRLYFYSNLSGISGCLPEGETMEMENLQVFDLTEMFGAGKEPSSSAEFFALFPKSLYAYNAGTLLSSKAASLISRGKNQCPGLDEYFRVIPGETYEVSGISAGGYLQEYDGNKTLIKTSSEITSATDITLDGRTVFCKLQATTYTIPFCYILWSTPNEAPEAYSATTVTLPNLELRSVPDFANNATICDVAYQAGGGTRKVGIVDLGTLDWQYSSQNGRFYVSFSGIKYKSTDEKTNMLCGKYDTSTYSANEDKTISGASSVSVLYVKDSAYSDAATFKAAMDGVMLVYELKNETDITTTENPGWDEYISVDNFGTLQFTQEPAQDIPVPQAYFIRYTVNPTEFLDTLGENAGWDADNVALRSDIVVPDAPTTDGTYTLKVTVSGGTPTYSWVSDS